MRIIDLLNSAKRIDANINGIELPEPSDPLLDYLRKAKLEEKPTVSEVKDATGEKYSGAEITEAWHEYEAE